MIHVDKNIRQLRVSAKFTQEEMAQTLNLKKNDLANWELGRNRPKIESAIQIAQYFSVTLDDLYLKDLSSEKISKNDIDREGENLVFKDKYIRLLEQVNDNWQRRDEIIQNDIKTLEASHDKLFKVVNEIGKRLSLNFEIAADERREIMILSQTTLLLLHQIASLTTTKPLQYFETISNNIKSAVESEYEKTDSTS